MNGIIFVAAAVAAITAAGLRAQRRAPAPGLLLMLALTVGSVWFVFG